MENLPIITDNQITGNVAATYLEAVMKKYCQFQPYDQSNDIGIDFIGTILKKVEPTKKCPTSYSFYVQCKGTEDSDLKLIDDGKKFSYTIKVSTINHWMQKKDPTFIFLVDVNTHKIYWVSAFSEIKDKDLQNQKTYNFHIPKCNSLDLNSDNLPESFKFEIIKYYANFADSILSQFYKISSMSSDIKDPNNIMEIISELSANRCKFNKGYDDTINKMIEKIKYSFERIVFYCSQLDNIPEVRTRYCPNGIYDYSFGTKTGHMTFKECKNKINALIESDNPSIEDLYQLYLDILELRGNYLFFYREMTYEDSPFIHHDNIEEELKEYLELSGK